MGGAAVARTAAAERRPGGKLEISTIILASKGLKHLNIISEKGTDLLTNIVIAKVLNL